MPKPTDPLTQIADRGTKRAKRTRRSASAFVENVQAIEEGIMSFERGEGEPAKEVLDQLAKDHDVS